MGSPDAAIRRGWHQGHEPALTRGWLVNRWQDYPAGIDLCLAGTGRPAWCDPQPVRYLRRADIVLTHLRGLRPHPLTP